MLYHLALETGLRWSELRSLTRASFDLDAQTPTVTVEAGYSKHRRNDTLPLRSETAEALRSYVADRLPGASAFPMPSSDRGYKLMQHDLAAARAAWIKQAEDPKERDARERSCFLRYEDEAGCVADFHSLRHTFITNLCNGGVHPKTAQALARHSTITLTMDRYTHLTVASQTDALDALPNLTTRSPATALRATGTADENAQPDSQSEGGKGRTFADVSGLSKGQISELRDHDKGLETQGLSRVSKPSANGTPGRIRTCDLRFRKPQDAFGNPHRIKAKRICMSTACPSPRTSARSPRDRARLAEAPAGDPGGHRGDGECRAVDVARGLVPGALASTPVASEGQ